jgi:hypothetical protein
MPIEQKPVSPIRTVKRLRPEKLVTDPLVAKKSWEIVFLRLDGKITQEEQDRMFQELYSSFNPLGAK